MQSLQSSLSLSNESNEWASKPPPAESTSETSDQTLVGDQDLEWKAGRREWLVMITLMIVSLMTALDASILVPVLPTIASALDGTALDTFWAGTSYLLPCAIVQPFVAALSDAFGRPELLMISIVFFTVGSIIICTCHDFTQMLAGRSIQGVGGGGVITLVLIICTDIVPLRQRPKYVGLIQLTWAFGSIIGPLVGGLLAQHTTWRWIFYINFPFCGIGLIMVPLVVRLKAKRTSIKSRLRSVDWVGGTLFMGSLISFLIGLTWGGIQFPWNSFQTLLPLLIGFVGIFIALAWEKWGTEEPFLRLTLFRNWSGVASYICATIQGLLIFAQLYSLALYLESVKNLSPTLTGVGQIAVSAGLCPSSAVVGVLLSRTGRFRWAIWSGWTITTLGTGLTILFDLESSTATWAIIFVLIGLGHGILLTALSFSSQAAASTRDVAYAASMYTFARTFGMCIGVAISGVVFQNQLAGSFHDAGLPTAIATDAYGFLVSLKAMDLSTSSQYYQHVLTGYAHAIRAVSIVLTGISAFGGLVGLMIGEQTLDRKLDSEHVLLKGESSVEEGKVSNVSGRGG